MTIKVQVNCDECARDLTLTTNCVDWRLRLSNEPKSSRAGFVTAMNIQPIIDSDKHFCGLSCLKKWIEQNV